MKLKFMSLFLGLYLLTCNLSLTEGERRRNVLDLIRVPINFIGNVTSIINDILWPHQSYESNPGRSGTQRKNFVTDNFNGVGGSNETTEMDDEEGENEIVDFREVFHRIVQMSRDQSHMRRTVVNRGIQRLLKLILPDWSILKPIERVLRRSEESARSVAICQACKLGLGAVVDYVRRNNTPKNLLEFAKQACPFLPMERDSCYGAIREYGEVIIYIIQNRPDLKADRMCGMFLQLYGCGTSDPYIYWDVLSDMGYPQFDITRKVPLYNESLSPKIIEGIPTMKILQLTDIHMDPLYRPGSRAQCRKEVCCRGSQVYGWEREFQAGFYGDYRSCDLPFHTFENALEHIAETHPDIDVIYMTGDLVPHTSIAWKSSPEEVKKAIGVCSKTIRKYFPNTPVIPVIGNHDTHPMNLFTPPDIKNEFSTDWVFKTAAKSWSQWLPQKSLDTFLKGGFYSRVINSQLRVIVLNNNVCFVTNFWLAYEDRDPSGQLHWLVEQLQEAEELKQSVHILAHLPPNMEFCWTVWSENYYRIIARFSSIIKGQFFAHTHHDDFGLYYDPLERDRPISSYFVGASLTPYINLNPGYKIYTVDGAREEKSTFQVLDHETWVFDLRKANSNPNVPPTWYRLYKARELYGLENLSPPQLHSLVERMASNETAFMEFYRYFFKAAVTEKSKECGRMCQKSRLCSMVSPTFSEYGKCVLLESSDRREILPRAFFDRQALNFRSLSGTNANNPYGMEPWLGHRVIGPTAKFYGY